MGLSPGGNTKIMTKYARHVWIDKPKPPELQPFSLSVRRRVIEVSTDSDLVKRVPMDWLAILNFIASPNYFALN
jgi:hypothetical protein